MTNTVLPDLFSQAFFCASSGSPCSVASGMGHLKRKGAEFFPDDAETDVEGWGGHAVELEGQVCKLNEKVLSLQKERDALRVQNDELRVELSNARGQMQLARQLLGRLQEDINGFGAALLLFAPAALARAPE